MTNKNKQLENIVELMVAMEQEVKDKIELPSYNNILLRRRLAYEELMETVEGWLVYDEHIKKVFFNDEKGNNAEAYKEVIDGIVDQFVILAGTFNAYGVTKSDELAHEKWNNLLSTYLNGDKFVYPESQLSEKVVLHFRNEIIKIIDSIESLSLDAYYTNTEINEKLLLLNLYRLMETILKMSVELGFKDKILFELIWDEIHSSNMSKLGEDGKPIKRADGKFIKGPNYRKPDVVKILNDYLK